jgi:hypothetical protein
MQELRCERGTLLAVLDGGAVEIKCRSSYCGNGSKFGVIHRFDAITGALLETRKFRDPVTRKGE